MDELDKLKESIIGRFEIALALNGNEICKEIDSILSEWKLIVIVFFIQVKIVLIQNCMKNVKNT